MSQLALAVEVDVSARHLSFVETGRSQPTRTMILRLCEHLEVPLRERNGVLLAGGYAPAYPEHDLDTVEMAGVRTALRQVLTGHEPHPALVVDRWWTMIDANASVSVFTDGCAEDLLEPPVNALRLSLHPHGMASRIANLGEWRAHVFGRLRRQVAVTADPALAELLAELRDYPCDQPEPEAEPPGPGAVMVPLRYRHAGRMLSFFSTTAVFGSPLDVRVAELAVESFFPADAATRDHLR